jgi:hypothetical protein
MRAAVVGFNDGPLTPHQRRASLRLTQAAVVAMQRQPDLIVKALQTLTHWDLVAPTASQPLRDEWRDILQSGQFSRALALTDRGQQLRQAASFARVLAPTVRNEIIRPCKGRSANT